VAWSHLGDVDKISVARAEVNHGATVAKRWTVLAAKSRSQKYPQI